MISSDTPLFQLSIREFQTLLKENLSLESNKEETNTDVFIYGIEGLARLLNCSNVTAQKIKNSGKIPYQQIGRKIIFRKSEVLAALSNEQ